MVSIARDRAALVEGAEALAQVRALFEDSERSPPAGQARMIWRPMTRDDIESLREGWDFEAKLAAGRDGQGAVPESLWETYSALANTAGGLILLGAREDREGAIEVRGLADPDRWIGWERVFWSKMSWAGWCW